MTRKVDMFFKGCKFCIEYEADGQKFFITNVSVKDHDVMDEAIRTVSEHMVTIEAFLTDQAYDG